MDVVAHEKPKALPAKRRQTTLGNMRPPQRKHGKVSFLRKAWHKARRVLLNLGHPQVEANEDMPTELKGWDAARALTLGTGQAVQDGRRLQELVRSVAMEAYQRHNARKLILADMEEALMNCLSNVPEDMEVSIGAMLADLSQLMMKEPDFQRSSLLIAEALTSKEKVAALQKLRDQLLDHVQSLDTPEEELKMSTQDIQRLMESIINQVNAARHRLEATAVSGCGSLMVPSRLKTVHFEDFEDDIQQSPHEDEKEEPQPTKDTVAKRKLKELKHGSTFASHVGNRAAFRKLKSCSELDLPEMPRWSKSAVSQDSSDEDCEEVETALDVESLEDFEERDVLKRYGSTLSWDSGCQAISEEEQPLDLESEGQLPFQTPHLRSTSRQLAPLVPKQPRTVTLHVLGQGLGQSPRYAAWQANLEMMPRAPLSPAPSRQGHPDPRKRVMQAAVKAFPAISTASTDLESRSDRPASKWSSVHRHSSRVLQQDTPSMELGNSGRPPLTGHEEPSSPRSPMSPRRPSSQSLPQRPWSNASEVEKRLSVEPQRLQSNVRLLLEGG